MTGHDVIVIGTSAGGLKALGAILGTLPADLDAVFFIVQHLAADKPRACHQIFSFVEGR